MSILLKPHAMGPSYRKVTCDCKQPADCGSYVCHTHSVAYLLGKQPPNYPVPATMHDANIAIMHLSLRSYCANGNGPCNACIDEYIDAVDYYFFPD